PLGRMRAKEPKARYQRADHLAQLPLRLAQKLGSPAELPDGVLFVDAPLPSPPRTRPILLTASALLGLVVLIVLLGASPWSSTGRVGGTAGLRGPRSETRSQ